MNITNKISWTAFLITLATLNLSPAEASVFPSKNQPSNSTVENRLARLVSVLKTKESQLPQAETNPVNSQLAGGFANRVGGGGFGNIAGGGGFANAAGGGGFANVAGGGGGFRNNWSDGGGFLNRRY